MVATTLAVTQFPGLSLDAKLTVGPGSTCRPCRHQLQPMSYVYFFFKTNRQDLIGAKRTPGWAFLCFLQEKTLTQCMLGRDGRNTKAFALCCGHAKITRRQKIVQVCCSRAFLLFPVFFASVFIFLRTKVVLVFFAVVIFGYFCSVCLAVLELLLLQSCCCTRAC